MNVRKSCKVDLVGQAAPPRSMSVVKPLPMVPASCSLNSAELSQQLERYRAAGRGAEVIGADPGRHVIRLAPQVPESLVSKLIEVERGCCPFYRLDRDRDTRQLSIGVSDHKYEPALDGLAHALGLGEPARA